MPQEYMSDNVLRTASLVRILSPVVGQIPPLARVAAIILADSTVASMEDNFKINQDSLNYLLKSAQTYIPYSTV